MQICKTKDQRPKTKDLSLRSEKGFTLIELSIVIVIIGLIVAGVVGGQALVEQGKLRQVVSEASKIKLAVNVYKLEYGELPGDHSRAADYWGQAASCFTDTTGSTDTCNGNGSKYLAYYSESNFQHEGWHFWKHLENAKIWDKNFTGFSDNSKCRLSNHCMEPGVNVENSSISGAGWIAMSARTTTKDWQGRAYKQDRNFIALTKPNPSNLDWWRAAYSLTTKQQYGIDSKIDDGFPYQGKIVDMSGTHGGFSPNCATANSTEFGNSPPGTTTINAEYNLSFQGLACMMFVDL